MKKLLLLLFVTSWWSLSAQNIDSLTKIVQSENQPDSAKWTASSVLVRYYLYRLPDSAQYFTALRYELAEKTKLPSLMAQALFELGIYNERMGNYEQGLDYLTRSLEMFEEMDNQRFISNVVNSIGAIYSSKRENDSALKYFLRSLEIDEAMGNRGGMAVSYNNVGDVYRNLGDYNQALDYYGKSIRISEELGLRDRMSTPLTNIGFIYSERGDPEQALSYFARSLAICEESGYLSGVGSALAQLGFVSEDLGELDQALDYYTRSVKVFQDLGQQNQLAVVLISMGNVAQKKGEARQARAYYTQSKEIYEALGIWDGLANTLTNLGESYRLEGNLPEAKVYAQEALDIAQAHEIGVLEVFESIYGLMYQVSKAENNPSLALDMHEKYIEIRDSVNREENQRATFRFEYERKALQDSLSFVEQQAQTELGYQQQLAERNYLLLGGLGLALLGGLGFYFWQQRRSREKEILHQKEMLNSTILTQEKERQRIAKDLHDSVGSKLSVMNLFLHQLTRRTPEAKEELDDMLGVVGDTIQTTRRISHDLLPPTLESFGLAHAIEELGEQLAQADGPDIHVKTEGERLGNIDSLIELNLFRVVQELLNNTLKYAQAQTVNLRLVQGPDKLILQYEDDGQGFDAATSQNQKGLGMKNLRSRLQMIGGKIDLQSAPGQGVRVQVEVAAK